MKTKILYFIIVCICSLNYSFAQNATVDSVSRQVSLDEVLIHKINSKGIMSVSKNDLDKIPILLGEKDLLKFIAMMPGIVTTSALDPGIYVRGGDSNENSYMVNGFPIANPEHLTGILSLYDAFVLPRSNLYKSGYPVRYNSSLSSYVNMLPYNDKDSLWSGELALGMLSSAFKTHIPIKKNNSTLSLSARASYLQHYAWLYNKMNENNAMPKYSFYDVTANYKASINSKTNVDIFALYTSDQLDLSEIDIKLKWSTLSLNGVLKHSTNRSNLYIRGGVWGKLGEGYSQASFNDKYKIGFSKVEADYDYAINDDLQLLAGVSEEVMGFSYESGYSSVYSLSTAWIGGRYLYHNNLSLEAGVNAQYYSGNTHHMGVSPRLKLNYDLGGWGIWCDYAQTMQYVSVATTLTIKSPLDIAYPLNKGSKPTICHQVSAGVDHSFANGLYVYGALFYKKFLHAKDYIGRLVWEGASDTETQVAGKGKAYGIEVDASYNSKSFYVRGNYTFSNSWRQFDDINQGKRFKAPFDITHNLMLCTSIYLSKNIKLNAMWEYKSGIYTTFPVGVAVAQDIYDNGNNPMLVPVFRDKYNFRLPATHRLDASVDWMLKSWTLTGGVYNLYNQPNISFLKFDAQSVDTYYVSFVPIGMVMLPTIPYLSIKYVW